MVPEPAPQLLSFTTQKANGAASAPDLGLAGAISDYLTRAVRGVRSPASAHLRELHLTRFRGFVAARYGDDRLGALVARDAAAWQRELAGRYAPSTVNAHLASLAAFCSWVEARDPRCFAVGPPTAGLRALPLPPLEPRALSAQQVASLKSVCDRLPRFAQLKGRRADGERSHAHARPWRDRAVVYVLLSTGLRREELCQLDLAQLEPAEPQRLRSARRARIDGVRGKGGTQRNVFLSAEARAALADYLERERPGDAGAHEAPALLLSAATLATRRPDGRLSPRAVNTLLARIGRLHDGEQPDRTRQISPLRPHDLRHTFAFALAEASGADAYELERRLGHRSQRYIARYTNPPEDVAAGYVEEL